MIIYNIFVNDTNIGIFESFGKALYITKKSNNVTIDILDTTFMDDDGKIKIVFEFRKIGEKSFNIYYLDSNKSELALLFINYYYPHSYDFDDILTSEFEIDYEKFLNMKSFNNYGIYV
jgi:hypothetical protein